MASNKRSAAERFWAAVVKQEGGCWLYNDHPDAYGRLVGDDGKRILAHRFSYQLHHGEIERGLYVCHKCDVRGCVNPDHLYAGTYEENNKDRVGKERYKFPIERKAAWRRFNKAGDLVQIPSEATKRDIRLLYESGKYTQTQLAKHFGLTQGTVSAYVRNVLNCGLKGDRKRRTENLRRKLSKEQLVEMVRLYEAGMTQVKIAERFGCTQAHVSRTVLKHRS